MFEQNFPMVVAGSAGRKLDDSFPRSLPDLPPTVARGLITAHAYTILNCVELGPGEDDPRLIQLRNPWNRHEW